MLETAATPNGPSMAERRSALAGAAVLLVCCCLPVLVSLELLAVMAHNGRYAVDFQSSYWAGGHDVLNGHSPLPPPDPNAPRHGAAYPSGPYPPAVAVLFAPFSLVPIEIASVVFTTILFGAVLLALWLAGVRDGRCYGATFAWASIFSGLQSGNLTLLIVLALAAIWRFRSRPLLTALLTGTVLAMKPFVWPLLIWLVATRRFAAAAWSVAIGGALTLATWSVVGLSSIRQYPDVLRIYFRYFERISYSPFALLLRLGLPELWARLGGIAIAVAAVAAVIVASRRDRGDELSFALAVLAAILCTPLVWLHYFALMLVPVAILRPVLSLPWLLPALLWLCPLAGADAAWKVALPLAVSVGVVALARRERPFGLWRLGGLRLQSAGRGA